MNKLSAVVFVAVFGLALAGTIDLMAWENRIVGGSTAAVGQFPHQVSLRSSANAHFCGGWIHNNRWAVSAAHCTVGRTVANTRVVVGAHSRTDGTSHASARIANHPNYNANTLTNDISCVQTSAAITFNARVATIPLATSNVGGGVSAVVSGWGQTDYYIRTLMMLIIIYFSLLQHPGSGSTNLMFLNTQTLTLADCRSRHGGNANFVHDNTICTLTGNNQGVCMGDSGGPVTVGGQVSGAVSWVIACARGFPDVHARVFSHRTWLLNTMV